MHYKVCLDEHDTKKKRCNNDNEDEDSTIAATEDEEAKIHIPTKLL